MALSGVRGGLTVVHAVEGEAAHGFAGGAVGEFEGERVRELVRDDGGGKRCDEDGGDGKLHFGWWSGGVGVSGYQRCEFGGGGERGDGRAIIYSRWVDSRSGTLHLTTLPGTELTGITIPLAVGPLSTPSVWKREE